MSGILMVTDFRPEQPGDEPAIRHVNRKAFAGPDEANLVDALRKSDAFVLSMVATDNGQVGAHILFTEVIVAGANPQFTALGLGPMAVLPSHQRRGIGSQLLESALAKCRELDYDIVVVVGHPEFYKRFGFVPAGSRDIRYEFDVPDKAFMLLELKENALAGRSGVVHYQQEFREV